MERILSYQKAHDLVSNQEASMMAILTTALAGIHTVMWVTVRRRRFQPAQALWGLPSPAKPSTSLADQIGSGISSEITGTGTRI